MSDPDYNPTGLRETMARIDANQAALLAEFRALRSHHEHDRQRINSLERWRSWNLGFSAAISAGGAAFWSWLTGGGKGHL